MLSAIVTPIFGYIMILRILPLAFYLLSFALVLLTDGGVYPFSLSISVLLMALSVLSGVIERGLHASTVGVFLAALLLWVAVAAWVVIQTLPLPGGLLSNAAWASLSDVGIDAAPRISVVPGDALYSLMPISLAFMTFLGALLLFRNDRQVERAWQIFGICGAGLALFAIVQTVLFPNTLMFGPRQTYFGSLTAPFVNRNTAATFYGVILVVLIVCYALAATRDARPSTQPVSIFENKWAFAFMALISAVAVALTQSRGGAAASLAGCTVLAVALIFHFRSKQRRRRGGGNLTRWQKVLIAMTLAALVMAAGGLLFGRSMIRAERQGLNDSRLCVTQSVLPAIAGNWAAGLGPASFRYYFPAYRNAECGLEGTWYRAHNFYVDTILALGVFPSLAAFVFAYSVLLGTFQAGLRRRKSMRPMIWGAISAVVIATVHAFTDFSLQIPAFSMILALISGLGIAISFKSSSTRSVSM
ncbi:O-antigen ligase domain-containing protein [Neorhizobium lilium]|uniref:O-antigen ligase domain-containing protein n=1 Tax=Neorhizobium lilium TaxID=2503024 RepID=A0A444LD48_9HYPH|nr:O-antigen ligase family protein [Neorhizobium lilium]RWX75761.1 O-antigen ligase domain-containing protein [Neorhizobium lilium]